MLFYMFVNIQFYNEISEMLPWLWNGICKCWTVLGQRPVLMFCTVQRHFVWYSTMNMKIRSDHFRYIQWAMFTFWLYLFLWTDSLRPSLFDGRTKKEEYLKNEWVCMQIWHSTVGKNTLMERNRTKDYFRWSIFVSDLLVQLVKD